jgi:hypothetical protein
MDRPRSTKEAFIQTDAGGCMENSDFAAKLFGGIDFKDVFQQLSRDLEKHLNQERDRDRDIKGMNPMFNPKIKIGMGEMCGLMGGGCGMGGGGRMEMRCADGMRCMVGGGTGIAMLSSFVCYAFILTLTIVALVCLLGYIFYLKYHNNCDNENCCFSLKKDFIEQIKTDVFNWIKHTISSILKYSISIIKNAIKMVQVSLDVYEKSVSELILHIEA